MPDTQLQQPMSRRDLLKLGGLLAAATAASACRPTGITTPTIPTTTLVKPATPFRPTATTAPVVEIEPTLAPPVEPPVPLEIIALNRLAFGPRPGALDYFRSLGVTPEEQLAAYVEEQLNPEAIDDSELDSRLAATGFSTLAKSREDLWTDHIANNKMQTDEDWYLFVQPVMETQAATMMRAVFSRRQLFEVLADFWHNHFNVYGWHESVAPMFAHYDRDVIRANALGNFRRMLEDVATSASMLYYLDNYNNQVAGPNENYARELFELHTLGAENYLGVADPMTVPGAADGAAAGYVDNDVYEAARCFTGWRVHDDIYEYEDNVNRDGAFLYHRPWHDRFNKLVLGKYIPADQEDMKDGHDVLDLLAAHPGTARFVCRKLCGRLVGDNPSEALVQMAADVFLEHKDSPDQLKQVTRAILLSDEFRLTWGQKIKRPFEAAVGTLRALDVDIAKLPDSFMWFYERIGQPLFGRTPPDGYPDVKESWANTMSLLNRWDFGIALIEGWIGDESGNTLTVDLFGQMPAEARTPNAIADFWIDRILGRPMSRDEDRAEIVNFIAPGADPDSWLNDDDFSWRLPGLVELILMSPDFQLR